MELQYVFDFIFSGSKLVDIENGTQPIKQKDDTVRVDPLDHLRKYRGGYEIRDLHYWSVRLKFLPLILCVRVCLKS